VVAALCREGQGGGLLISQGVWCKAQLRRYGCVLTERCGSRGRRPYQEFHLSVCRVRGYGYGYVWESVVPRLEKHGVAAQDIRRMLEGQVTRWCMWLMRTWLWIKRRPREQTVVDDV
jgi:hypothetical protein